MKIDLKELKKAVAWVEANSNDLQVRIDLAHDGRNLSIKCEDRSQVSVEITLFSEQSMKAKIRKEDTL